MINFELLKDRSVLVLRPEGALTAGDFRRIAEAVDPYILETGKLTGLLIEAPYFPGWDSLGALVEHMKFVKNHHRQIDRIAVVTDSEVLKIAPKIAEHFAHPTFKVFGSGDNARAIAWLESGVSSYPNPTPARSRSEGRSVRIMGSQQDVRVAPP